jgi:hypothetical protein
LNIRLDDLVDFLPAVVTSIARTLRACRYDNGLVVIIVGALRNMICDVPGRRFQWLGIQFDIALDCDAWVGLGGKVKYSQSIDNQTYTSQHSGQ